MNYVSYQTLVNDTKALSESIPRKHYDAIIAVPRSGLIPAAILGFELDIPVLSPHELLNGELFTSNRMHQRSFADIKRVLVIDDSINAGGQHKQLRDRFKDVKGIEIDYGVLYGNNNKKNLIKYMYRSVPGARQFEWNILNSARVKFAGVDIDGVLCKDPQFVEKSNLAGEQQMKNHILNAEPLHIIRYPILALITNRLEKYRKETEIWCKKYGIQYKHLIMSQAPSPEVRRKQGSHAEHKVKAMNQVNAQYFIESSIQQSQKIHQLSKKPVFCVDTRQMFV